METGTLYSVSETVAAKSLSRVMVTSADQRELRWSQNNSVSCNLKSYSYYLWYSMSLSGSLLHFYWI
ncbi:hypothetical protein PILCRDRAFT_276671 [Piloderma croceum F 1598]|uniref:Uncharacterized protein n=1 Tax=Piloderma croceum (strain F 1598) TaxID=765440 RepID=A0A0C3BLV1_PILCF|nr:hypothetical protein PILCRDRAFT_276671 [Piloderma croceum F 1598]